MLSATGMFENIARREGNIPVGSWPRGERFLLFRIPIATIYIDDYSRSRNFDRWTVAMDGLRVAASGTTSLFSYCWTSRDES